MKKKQIRNKKGITLIALIITVVIMLILAGVAISAVINGDGLFDKTKYATELQSFSQMQEAIQLYNFNNAIGNTNTLPVTRNVSVEELESNQNLKTEIGYYRVFLLTGERPILPQDFSGDFMETPSGVADLYYLDNEKLNVNTNKQYIYDTVTGEIYLIEGIKVKGQIAYSESRMKEIMNENYVPSYVENVTMPVSPESGTGAGYDYEFTDSNSIDTNLYKLYNNGDVYGIGQKGILLQTSVEEMESLRNDKWQEINFEEILPRFSKIFVGSQMYRSSQVLITDDGEAYVSGLNGRRFSNKFGLSQEVLETYNRNKLNKLDFKYGKIKRVFTGDDTTFIITEDNKLYAVGINTTGQLGVGTYESTEEYMEVKGIEDVDKIENIHTHNDLQFVIIEMEDNSFYFAGSNASYAIGDGRSNSFKTNTFVQIWNEGEFDIDQDIKKLSLIYYGTVILKNDGTLMIATSRSELELTDFIDTDKTKFRRLREEVGSNISNFIVSYGSGIIIEKTQNEEKKFYGYSYDLPTYIGIGEKNFTVDEKKFYEIELPSELKEEGVKEIGNMYGRDGIIYISNAGNVYYTGESKYSGIEGTSGVITEVTKLPISNIECIYDTGITYGMTYPYLQGKDGKIYTIQNPLSQLNKSLYNYNFKRILTDVKEISTNGDRIAYVDNNNNLYVAGNDRSQLGIGATDGSEQKEFVKVEDPNIANKVENVYVGYNMYVLTTDKILYGTGSAGTNGVNAAGWSERKNQINFVEILSGLEGCYISQNRKIAYNQEKVWIWYGGSDWGQTYNTPYEINLSEISSSLVNNIENVICNMNNFFILTKDGEVWSRGYGQGSGTGVNHSNFQQIPQSSFDSKKIIKIATSGYDRKAFIALAEDGTLYGWGEDSSILGLGITSTVAQNTPIKLSIDNIKDVIGTSSGFIVTKNNGEVWVTGNNANGIFGRWISSDAKYAKTVNQNAYEWVRSPSLEK